MNRSHLWKLVLILLVVAWSVSEIYPPTSKNLIEAFEQQSSTPNKTFDEIVKKAPAVGHVQHGPNTGDHLLELVGRD